MTPQGAVFFLKFSYFRGRINDIGFTWQPCCMAGTIGSFSYGEKILCYEKYFEFIVPAMKHGCRATYMYESRNFVA